MEGGAVGGAPVGVWSRGGLRSVAARPCGGAVGVVGGVVAGRATRVCGGNAPRACLRQSSKNCAEFF